MCICTLLLYIQAEHSEAGDTEILSAETESEAEKVMYGLAVREVYMH